MKILFLSNNSNTQTLQNWLVEQGVELISHQDQWISELDEANPDLIISYSYRHIIKKDVLAKYPGKFINLHIAYLPFNRGADPNLWSVIEGTPSGVTIHVIDDGIDTGPIIAQRLVAID